MAGECVRAHSLSLSLSYSHRDWDIFNFIFLSLPSFLDNQKQKPNAFCYSLENSKLKRATQLNAQSNKLFCIVFKSSVAFIKHFNYFIVPAIDDWRSVFNVCVFVCGFSIYRTVFIRKSYTLVLFSISFIHIFSPSLSLCLSCSLSLTHSTLNGNGRKNTLYSFPNYKWCFYIINSLFQFESIECVSILISVLTFFCNCVDSSCVLIDNVFRLAHQFNGMQRCKRQGLWVDKL